jgi:diguanylate cyclase (GGDEF)-like protein
MRIDEKDYRYLLLHVVPTHRLPPALRRQVEHALVAGSTRELRRQSVRALEALCEDDYFARVGVRAENGDVVVEYKKKRGRFQLAITVPKDEWPPSEGHAAAPPEVRPPAPEANDVARAVAERVTEIDGQGDAERIVTPSGAPDPYAFVTDLVRSFAVADRSEPVMARLESLLETLQRIVDVEGIQLFVRDDVLDDEGASGDLVRIVSDAELRATDVLREAIEAGAQRLYDRGTLDSGRWALTGGDWKVLGVAPVFSMGKVHGVLCALFAGGLDRGTMNSRLQLAVDTVRRIIEYHNQIGNMTSFDALTGVYNRHFFDDQLPVEIERAMRSGSVVSMLVIDIDNFKRVNDELGHKKGDEALAAVAELIRRNLRKVDLPFRYGGEEFVILLPGTSEFESVHTGERLRRVISQYEGFRDHRGRPRQLTVCVGVSVFPDTAKSPDELFTQADRAMYRAKQAGKNRVVLYRPGSEDVAN